MMGDIGSSRKGTNKMDKKKRDEVHDYVNGRYLSATEAAWRILGYNITKKNPVVKCLPIHLSGQNRQQFRRARKCSVTLSLLDRYFLRPNTPEYNTMTYLEYNEKCMLVPNKQGAKEGDGNFEMNNNYGAAAIVKERRKQNLVCRIRLLLPRAGDVFYLRQILLHRLCRDWTDAKTVHGVEYDTYQKAAEALGLTNAANEADLVMEEATALSLSPSQLRFLFALLLMDQAPAIEFWNKYRNIMTKDLFQRYDENDELAYNECLHLLNDTLLQHSTNVAAFGLPIKPDANRDIMNELCKFADVEAYQLKLAEMTSSFTKNQQQGFDKLCAIVDKKDSVWHVFVDGKAGTGKIYLLNALCLYV